MRSEHVIALDPGHRTGWAAARLSKDRITDLRHGVLPYKDMALALVHRQITVNGDELPPDPFDVIVFEKWIPREQNGSMDWIRGNPLLEVQNIGQFKLAAWLSGAKLKSYGPDRKRAFTASMPPAMRQRFEGCHEQHDQDALMHLWGYTLENWVTNPNNVAID